LSRYFFLCPNLFKVFLAGITFICSVLFTSPLFYLNLKPGITSFYIQRLYPPATRLAPIRSIPTPPFLSFSLFNTALSHQKLPLPMKDRTSARTLLCVIRPLCPPLSFFYSSGSLSAPLHSPWTISLHPRRGITPHPYHSLVTDSWRHFLVTNVRSPVPISPDLLDFVSANVSSLLLVCFLLFDCALFSLFCFPLRPFL